MPTKAANHFVLCCPPTQNGDRHEPSSYILGTCPSGWFFNRIRSIDASYLARQFRSEHLDFLINARQELAVMRALAECALGRIFLVAPMAQESA